MSAAEKMSTERGVLAKLKLRRNCRSYERARNVKNKKVETDFAQIDETLSQSESPRIYLITDFNVIK